jgi:hypothetical protein
MSREEELEEFGKRMSTLVNTLTDELNSCVLELIECTNKLKELGWVVDKKGNFVKIK